MFYPDNAVPLIIVGRQRAGTRFVTNALNRFPEITVHGEIADPVMDHVQRFIEDTEGYYRRKSTKGDRYQEIYQRWLERKPELIFSIWANAGQSRILQPDADCRYFGYKRPNNEFCFSFYEEHFAASKPVYVYCVRNFVDNYLSIVTRWPEKKISRIADEYLKSLRQFRKMKEAAPNRVLEFVLDRQVEEGVPYLEKQVIDRLDVRKTPQIIRTIKRLKSKNSSEKFGLTRRTELTPTERRFVDRRPALRSEFEALFYR